MEIRIQLRFIFILNVESYMAVLWTVSAALSLQIPTNNTSDLR